MDIRIAGTQTCSLNNGPGVRFVVFVQGCSHHCEGCHNPLTWDAEGGMTVKTKTLAEVIKRHNKIDGVTISGGEPFEQREACAELIKLLPDHLNVWIYTGYSYEEIEGTELAKLADYIVVGKFERDKLVNDWYGGSSNQQVINVKEGTTISYGEKLHSEL